MIRIYRRKCALCQKTINKFLPLDPYYKKMIMQYGYKVGKTETMNEREYSCPNCYGSDRDRLCALFFNRLLKYRVGVFENVKLLDIAPSGAIQGFLFHQLGEIIYDTADLFREDVDYKVDIQNMSIIDDEKYDLLICSHVLEHVKDDKKALEELYRILKPNGLGILLVPLDLEQNITDEQYGLSEEENWKRFGQGDHIRKYCKQDFIERMEKSFLVGESIGIMHLIKRQFCMW